jgi:hypothetical protein
MPWFAQHGERDRAEHEHARQRDDERRDAEVGDPVALERADQRAAPTVASSASGHGMCGFTMSTAEIAPSASRIVIGALLLVFVVLQRFLVRHRS